MSLRSSLTTLSPQLTWIVHYSSAERIGKLCASPSAPSVLPRSVAQPIQDLFWPADLPLTNHLSLLIGRLWRPLCRCLLWPSSV
jgi:hypothetical protein